MNGLHLPVNFRDLSGTVCAGGKTIKPKRLLRSGQLVGLSPGDQRVLLETHGLKCVIDLRDGFERQAAPDMELPGVQYHRIDLFAGDRRKAPGAKMLAALATPRMVAGFLKHFMKRSYRHMLRDEAARRGYAQMLDVLLGVDEGAALIHCFAGKDRSGLGVAIVLAALGAPHEAIVQDYLKSNEAADEIATALADAPQYASFGGGDADAVKTVAQVREEYLYEALKTAAAECGTLEAFARQALGLTDKKRDQMREMYLQ